MDTDRELILRCLEQEVAAQNQFYRRYASKMFGICLRYAGNAMEAEDILQDGFIRIYRSLHHFRFEGSLEGWVRRIIVNTAINHQKKNMKLKYEVELTEINLHATLSEDAVSNLSKEELLRIIHSLPAGYRTVFNLYVIEGYNHKEIGALLGVSENTSKTQLMRARLSIQETLKKLEVKQ